MSRLWVLPVLALVAVLAMACSDDKEDVSSSARSSSPTQSAGSTEAPPPSATPAMQGSLVVSPSSGPIGTTVQISGTGCNNLGQSTGLVFEGGNGLSGTLGGVGIPNIPTDADGHFTTTFTIPATIDTLQGRGGGPVVPGAYQFASKPPLCFADFTVTGPPSPLGNYRYEDSINGFTFEYPSHWFLVAPSADPAIAGYGVVVSSYDIEKARPIGVAPPPEELKIDITVEPNPDGLTAEEWITQRIAGPDEGVTTISEEMSAVGGEPAVKRVVSIQETRVMEYFFAHEAKMYFIAAYTADSVLIGNLDAIVESFKFSR